MEKLKRENLIKINDNLIKMKKKKHFNRRIH